jgi:hypothetical protein
MNRGQVVRLTYLNAASPDKQPSLWLDLLHKSVKLKFRIAHHEFLGVPRPAAALAGSALGLVVLALMIALVDNLWLAATLCLIYGLLVIAPGALLVRAWRWLRDAVGG